MSFFDDVPDDPYAKPDNTYLCSITNSQVKPTKKGDKLGWNLNLSIVEGEYVGSDIFEWLNVCPVEDDTPKYEDASTRDLAAIKQRLLQFGVPHSTFANWSGSKAEAVKAMAEFLPELVGTENLAVKWGNNRIQDITVVTDAEAGKPATGGSFIGSI